MKNKCLIIALTVLLFQNSFLCVLASNSALSIDAAKTAHELYEKKDYKASAQYYEKAFNSTGDNLFKENAIVSHSNHIIQLDNSEKYNDAVIYCETVLKPYHSNPRIREAMSEMYYSRGVDFFYDGKYKEAKKDFENSLTYANVEEQKDRAIDSLAKTNKAIKHGLVPKKRVKTEASQSIPDSIALIEKKVYGSTYSDKPILERVSTLEKDKLGKIYNNESLIARIQRLKTHMGIKNVALTKDDYISAIIEQSNGKVSIFHKMPIMIYFQSDTPEFYKKEFKDIAKEGFAEWGKINKRLKFDYTNNPRLADIQVVWKDEYKDFNWSPTLQTQDIDEQKKRMKYKKASSLVKIGSIATMVAGSLIGVPFLGSVGSIGSGLASPLLDYKSHGSDINTEIVLGTRHLKGLDDSLINQKIRQMAMHQIGHAIGIYGHSNNPNDIMCEYYKTNTLSERDINTINEIYKEKVKDSK